MSMRRKPAFLLSALLQFGYQADAQRFLTDMMDTTTTIGRGIFPLYGKYDRLRFGGYMQPQFQWAQAKGARNYSGGDFAPNSDNRFMLRRGRIRVDYLHFNNDNQPLAFFAFQFDGTERGVAIRDFWGRFYENRLELFSLTAGMFARPMGFEANLSSSDREAPERGRMSQILMKTERDIGAMLTLDARKINHALRRIKFDIGVFNGQGLAGPGEYDSRKDVISRLSLKPYKFRNGWTLSASVSGYYGGITSQSALVYKITGNGEHALARADSSAANIGYTAPRQYYGADAQLRIPNRKGFTEFRAEYIRGLQTGTAASSETPGTYPAADNNIPLPLYTRPFDGAYFYYLQHLSSERLQLVLKYDWYDPDKRVRGRGIAAARGLSAADVRYNTLGGGFVYYINTHVKATVYYDWITNESTALNGYTGDLRDNIFTCRLQFRF